MGGTFEGRSTGAADSVGGFISTDVINEFLVHRGTVLDKSRFDDGMCQRLVGDRISRDEWEKVLEEGWRVAHRILGNDTDAGEAVGKATEKVVRTQTEPDNLGGYFVTAVRNAAIDIHNRCKGTVVFDGQWDWSDDCEDGVYDAILAQEGAEILANSIDELPATDREIIRLRFWENMSFEGIGRVLNTSTDTARKRCNRAVQKLRGLVASYFEREHDGMLQASA